MEWRGPGKVENITSHWLWHVAYPSLSSAPKRSSPKSRILPLPTMVSKLRPRRDTFGRVIQTQEGDHAAEKYLHPHNGRVVPLVVQQATSAINADELGGSEATGTWERSGRVTRNVSAIIRLAQWARSSVFAWVPACILLFFLVSAHSPPASRWYTLTGYPASDPAKCRGYAQERWELRPSASL